MQRDILSGCPPSFRGVLEKMAAKVTHPTGKSGRASKPAAIRIKCLECCNWQPSEVRRCQIRDCALWGLGGQAE